MCVLLGVGPLIVQKMHKKCKQKKVMKILKIQKNTQKIYQKNWKISKTAFFQKKNAILLVLPVEENNLWPELSSSARFRILGGYPEPDGAGNPCV